MFVSPKHRKNKIKTMASSNWKVASANTAGPALSVCTPQTLDNMWNDVLQKNIVSESNRTGCMFTNLNGDRVRKCASQEDVRREQSFWATAFQGPARTLQDEFNNAYWNGSSDRKNHSVLVYHLAAYKRYGLPPPNTNASHICGFPGCVNPLHLAWEEMQYNATRNYCIYMATNNPAFNVNSHCLHNPKCIV